MEREKPRPQEFYRHFKNKLYQIITVAKHSETGEELVIYQALYGSYEVYARPLSMFLSEVDYKKYPDSMQKYRFQKVYLGAEQTKKEADGQQKASLRETVSDNQKSSQSEMKSDSTEEVSHSGKIENDNQKNSSQFSETKSGEELPNPDLLEFLDADTMEQKKRILIGMKDRITDRLIDDIAASLDVEIGKGEVSERYKSLMVCVNTLERFEVNRLR
ncbi:MAG: DUF1653 domain-containing protein [Lachnospiraceae bacterium]|nr:DUF1653 domain-containing protein [Lachnospiraceae bacterium]